MFYHTIKSYTPVTGKRTADAVMDILHHPCATCKTCTNRTY